MKFKYYLRGAGIGMIVASVILSIVFVFQDNVTDEEVIRRALELGMVMQDNHPDTLGAYSKADDQSSADDSAADGDSLDDAEDKNTEDKDKNTEDKNSKDENSEDKNTKDNHPDNLDEVSDTGTSGGSDKNNADKADTENSPQPSKSDKKDSSGNKKSADEPGSLEDQSGTQSEPENSKTKEPDNAGPDKNNSGKVTVTVNSGDVSRKVSARVHKAGLVEDAEEFNNYLGANGYANLLQPGTYEIEKGSSFQDIAHILTGR